VKSIWRETRTFDNAVSRRGFRVRTICNLSESGTHVILAGVFLQEICERFVGNSGF